MGECKVGECIYDYDIYSDLGQLEESKEFECFNLGGNVEYFYLC